MKKAALFLSVILIACLLGGCHGESQTEKEISIPFKEGQLYAAAYLGYLEINDMEYYTENFLGGSEVPVHYVSQGEYYLIIPRYEGTSLELYKNTMGESEISELIYTDPCCSAFIVQCNISDIFPDITVKLSYDGKIAEFSPYISLKDGSFVLGEQGFDITKK